MGEQLLAGNLISHDVASHTDKDTKPNPTPDKRGGIPSPYLDHDMGMTIPQR